MLRPQTGLSTPVAATRRTSPAKAARIAATAPGSSSVSASTVTTTSVRISPSAAFSARALPPWGSRSQERPGTDELRDTSPSAGSASP